MRREGTMEGRPPCSVDDTPAFQAYLEHQKYLARSREGIRTPPLAAHRIYEEASQWWKPPDIIFLFIDDFFLYSLNAHSVGYRGAMHLTRSVFFSRPKNSTNAML